MSGGSDDSPQPHEVFDPRRLFVALSEADIDYILIGGFAVAAHGAPRATEDLDICPNPEEANLRRLADFLASIGARNADLGEFEPGELPSHDFGGLRGGGNFRLLTDLGRFDVMQHVRPFEERTWQVLDKRADPRQVFGVQVRVCSYEDLIEMKRATDRPQDRVDIANVKAARREL